MLPRSLQEILAVSFDNLISANEAPPVTQLGTRQKRTSVRERSERKPRGLAETYLLLAL